MLKWAINEPRQSYFPCTPEQLRAYSLDELSHLPTSSFHCRCTDVAHSHCLHQQSLESVCLGPNKANQVTSTPLLACSSSPAKRQPHKKTPSIRKLNSLRDLSSIFPEHTQNITPQRRTFATAQRNSEYRNASTLPTLDVNEYSPSCALIPGPLLALRGLAIPDAYFEKPRYLSQLEDDETVAAAAAPQIGTPQPRATLKLKVSPPRSLSSSQMDESTLERMIDAIIASSHKDNKLPTKSSKHAHATSRSCSMSPTYTAAYDPASDLDDLWWDTDRAYFRANNITLTQSSESSEHILRTPKSHKFRLLNQTFRRGRQRPVRRKRRLTNFRNTVKKSARKLLRVGSSVSVSMPQLNEDNEDESSGTHSQPSHSHTNLSPDSGHNSSSADSSKTDDQETKDKLTNKEATEVEVTKRRLSFSQTHCN